MQKVEYTVQRRCGWANGNFHNLMRLAQLKEFTVTSVYTDLSKWDDGQWFFLEHEDGRVWVLHVWANEYGVWVGLHDYKSKNGDYNPASDANSCAYDKMVVRLLKLGQA